MITKGLKKYLTNPSLGIIVSILYVVLFAISGNVELSIFISMIFALVSDIALRYITKSRVSSMLILLTFCALLLNLIVWFILKSKGVNVKVNIAIFEIFMIILLSIAKLSRTYLGLYVGKRLNSIQKTMFGEFFDTARLMEYAFTIHLFIIIVYKYIKGDNPIDAVEFYWSDIIVGVLLLIVFLLLIIIWVQIKTRSVVTQLRGEEWLPIVNEAGEVTGRVARSVSAKMKNKFLHPVVRIALIHDGTIYLQPRANDDILDPGSYDHPFEKYMQFNHEVNTSIRNCIAKKIEGVELPFNFLIKYVFENDNTKRLVFLYVSRIETEEQIDIVNRSLNGKFWSPKQIEESMSEDRLFCECFQMEYEYLKNTVLFADMVRKNMP